MNQITSLGGREQENSEFISKMNSRREKGIPIHEAIEDIIRVFLEAQKSQSGRHQ